MAPPAVVNRKKTRFPPGLQGCFPSPREDREGRCLESVDLGDEVMVKVNEQHVSCVIDCDALAVVDHGRCRSDVRNNGRHTSGDACDDANAIDPPDAPVLTVSDQHSAGRVERYPRVTSSSYASETGEAWGDVRFQFKETVR